MKNKEKVSLLEGLNINKNKPVTFELNENYHTLIIAETGQGMSFKNKNKIVNRLILDDF